MFKRMKKMLAVIIVFTLLPLLPAAVSAAPAKEFHIKIVHTGDIHARVVENEKSGIIGHERTGGIIDSFTNGADLRLVLDSGDLFHGQPIATLVRGESIAKLTEACGYDAMTPGNHDFSYGK